MSTNKTFAMIKPTAFRKGYHGHILNKITEAGFRLSALKMIKISRDKACLFYAVHKDKPFFDELVDFISSDPVIVMILEKENAVKDFRELIGSTNPEFAKEGTIRKLYATDLLQNAIHGSDCDENALIESDFFFSVFERC
ncbi:MAG: nucleoside-diphosphate kinase [Bacteroidota bacterium]|nr:nucleoside-diphosphate kinase [Bacteroidota bacterium]